MADLTPQVIEDLRPKALLRNLSDDVPDMAAAYDLQDAVTAAMAAQRGGIHGRKIAWNMPALMAQFGLDRPAMACVFGDDILLDGSTIDGSGFHGLALEPELGAIVGKDVPAGLSLTAETVLDYVTEFRPVFELLERRNAADIPHPPSLVAYNILNAGAVMGSGKIAATALDPQNARAVFSAAGKELLNDVGTAPQDPLEAAATILSHFSSRGAQVAKGEVLLCGTHYPPLSITENGSYQFDIAGLGSVSLVVSGL